MNLIPMPKKIEKYEGFLENKAVCLKSNLFDERLLKAIDCLPVQYNGTGLEIHIQDLGVEEYSIKIEQDNILITAGSEAGAFYAIQTLRQLFLEEEIPCCYIEDKPDFSHRGFYHDITRGRVPKLDTLKKLVDDMAYYKLNSLQLYVEHVFEFKEYADSIERTGYMTAEEIRELDEYCKMNFIELIPSLSTFGHLYELLQKDRYKHLREVEDFKEIEFIWENRQVHHTIDPTCEESFELIKSLIDQYMVNFSSDKFNICCDETFDLKIGKHKDEDTGKLYIDFVSKIVKYLQDKGKTVMMWADILLNHPEQIENLPDGVKLLNWYYWEKPDENTFKTIRDSGKEQIVCPGTGSWARLCEDYEMDIINIPKMAEYGYKYGAEGVLNTNWGDLGNSCSIPLAMFGLVLGAEKSWNIKTAVDENYTARVNKLLYKKDNATEYIKRLSNLCSRISWTDTAKTYANILCGHIYDVEYPSAEELSRVVCDSMELIEDINHDIWENKEYKEQIILSAEGVAVMAELIAVYQGHDFERKTDTKKWIKKYREKWLEDSKESELREIEKMFFVLGGVL